MARPLSGGGGIGTIDRLQPIFRFGRLSAKLGKSRRVRQGCDVSSVQREAAMEREIGGGEALPRATGTA
jgi:hypothetical protein